MLYCKQVALRGCERKGGCFVQLLSFLFLIVLIVVIKSAAKSAKEKREEAGKRPQNAAQRGLVDEVIAAIERSAHDFDGAFVHPSSRFEYAPGDGYVSFGSLGGNQFKYDFKSHGYVVSEKMALILASEIAKHFGGECRSAFNYDHDFCGYNVVSLRQLAEEREKKRREDSLKRL